MKAINMVSHWHLVTFFIQTTKMVNSSGVPLELANFLSEDHMACLFQEKFSVL